MPYNKDNPLIIQGDRTILLDVHAPAAEKARNALIPFAELEKSPEHLHTYRITPLSLWNAASAGFSPETVSKTLEGFSRFPIPGSVQTWVEETMGRFGTIRLLQSDNPDYLILITDSSLVYRELEASRQMQKYLLPAGTTDYAFLLAVLHRGTVKQELLKMGWPVKDEAPLKDGEPLDVRFLDTMESGDSLEIRDYQHRAAAALVGDKGPGTGFGTIVLPCGSGKTVVGMIVMEMLATSTLILTTNVAAVHQWIDELVDKTNLSRDQIGEYTGDTKIIKPVTIATYQILTWRPDKESPFPHFSLFRERAWGLIIYDEVHLLPAPVFRVTAELQTVRRLGLTATLVREDGREGDVFSLVGPKRYDVPWKDLEGQGWIATALCMEIRVPLAGQQEINYAVAGQRQKYRIASENEAKMKVVTELLRRHSDDSVLVIGQYIQQLEKVAATLNVPLITGKTPNVERDRIYADFRNGKTKAIVVSKVANFAIDLPDASVAIQISGSFGSRQEEAQRLGRIMRPKEKNAMFYTIVTARSVEEDFAANRQKFLAEQGYEYSIVRWDESVLDYTDGTQ
ncbi:MAG TPA: DEAD/DEAH box helicase [Treponema sp.]|nr:DEAD/DEAH box helicase [Treponema sp.]